MPQATYIKSGDVQTHTAAAALSAGDVVQLDASRRAGVAVTDVANGAEGEFYVRGVLDVTKKSGQAIADGAVVYWDDTNNQADITGDFAIGVAVKAAGASDATVRVDLNHYTLIPGMTLTFATVANGVGNHVIFAAAPARLRLVDWHIVCTDNVAGTVKLDNGTADITATINHGTSDTAIVRGGTIDDATHTIAPGGTARAVVATGGNSIVYSEWLVIA